VSAIAFLLGDWWLQQFSSFPKSWVGIFGVFLVLPRFVSHCLPSGCSQDFLTKPAKIVAWCVAGFLWGWFFGYQKLSEQLPAFWEGKNWTIEGRISSIPKSLRRGVEFDFDSSSISGEGETQPWKRGLRLSWYEFPPHLIVGERWRLAVRLKRPHGLMNPGGFDQETWWFENHIQALGTVKPKLLAERLDASHWSYSVNRARQILVEAISKALPDSPYLGLLQGLAVGETSAVPRGQWDVLTKTGTIHLLAISGSHIALVAGLAYWIVRKLWSWLGTVVLRIPAPRAGAVAAILAALGYAALAGLPLSTQRAAIMVTVAMGAMLMNRVLRPMRTLRLALFAVLLWDPLAVVAPGFWLSFGAVFFILYTVAHSGADSPSHLRTFVRVQWAVTIGLLPLLLSFFDRVAIYSPLANLIAIPWLEIGTVPVVLGGTLLLPWFPTAGTLLLSAANYLLMGLLPILGFFATLPSSDWGLAAPPKWAIVTGTLGAILLLAPRGVPARWLGCLGMAPLFLLPQKRPAVGEACLTVLDVGQGLSTVVRTSSHTLVYDTGPSYGNGQDAGGRIVAPYLRHEGIRTLDVLMVSHGDDDHRGGAASLLAEFQVVRVLGSAPGGEPCIRGTSWHWDGIDFRVIHPAVGSSWSGNNGSCVLRVEWPGGSLILPGDIQRPAETELVRETPENLPTTVLIAPHHGSSGSSSTAFVAAVAPKLVVYSTGYQNRFGFPRQNIVDRYSSIGAQSYDTTKQGALELRLGKGISLEPHSWREEARRYWHF